MGVGWQDPFVEGDGRSAPPVLAPRLVSGLAFGLWPGQNRRERMAVTAVIGRDEALGSIRAFFAAVERGPMALVLSGEAGIGKTIL